MRYPNFNLWSGITEMEKMRMDVEKSTTATTYLLLAVKLVVCSDPWQGATNQLSDKRGKS